MLPIYICENNAEIMEMHADVVNEYVRKNFVFDMKIVCQTQNPFEMLEFVKLKHPGQSLYFISLVLDAPLDGITLAHEIRKYDPRGYIVILATSIPQKLSPLFETEAMVTIEENDTNTARRLMRCMDIVRNLDFHLNHPYEERSVNLLLNGQFFPFPQKEIRYIATSHEHSHGIEIHTENNKYQYRGILEDILPQMDYSFCRCHRHCLVNMRHVDHMEKENRTLILDNGEIVPVSRRVSKEIEQFLFLLKQ